MVRRTPSLILEHASSGGRLYGSGTFWNMEEWVQSDDISLVVTTSTRENPRLRKFTRVFFYNMQDSVELETKLQDVLLDMTDTIYSGRRVLVHCIHGLHRTGSLITLWLALTLAGGDFGMGADKPENMTTSSWTDRLTEAWNLWADKRQLNQATAESWSRRDFAAESWDAMLEFWQEMPLEQVLHMIDQLRKSARNAYQRRATSSGCDPLHARLSIGAAAAASSSTRAAAASSSSTPTQSVQSEQSELHRRRGRVIVLKPRPKARLAPRATPAPPPQPLTPKQRPAAKAMPKKLAHPPTAASVQPQQSEQPVEPPPVPSLQPSQPSEPSRKKPRGSAAVEVPGEDRGEPWVPGQEWQAGDWRCRVCNNHNWRRRGFCNGNGGRCKEPRDLGFGPRDWYCRCGNWNLAGRSVCNRGVCKTPRSEGEQPR